MQLLDQETSEQGKGQLSAIAMFHLIGRPCCLDTCLQIHLWFFGGEEWGHRLCLANTTLFSCTIHGLYKLPQLPSREVCSSHIVCHWGCVDLKHGLKQ